MDSKHWYGILMMGVFLVFITGLMFGAYKVIEAFATGEWDMTASITALLTLFITIFLSHVISKALDNRFSNNLMKNKNKENIKVKLVKTLGNILVDINREENNKELYVLYHMAQLYFHDKLCKILEEILNKGKVSSSQYEEIVQILKKD